MDVSDEEFLQFDTSGVPVIVTLTKVTPPNLINQNPFYATVTCMHVLPSTIAGWKALHCRCNFRGGIPNELSCFYFC